MTTKPSEQLTQLLTVTIDGVDVEVPKGTLVIRAAEEAGIHIPRFCDHPLLKPAGACRQCLVEVSAPDREGNLRPMPKPQASCTLEATDGMQVATQNTSETAGKAQHGVMEFLLINHPLDCPVCDKGGECPLQNQALSNGRATSRFTDVKRTFPKPLKISSQILLDRDRCILCQRCTRFSEEIAGDPFIALQGRGGGSPGDGVHGTHGQQVGTFDARVLDFAMPEPEIAGSDSGCGSGGAGCGCGGEGHNGSAGGNGRSNAAESLTSGPDGQPGVVAGFASGPVGAAETDTSGRPFSSYFSGNTIQICPVGALTSAAYRFRSRPFDLVSTQSVAEHDAGGSAIRIDHRRGAVLRRLAGDAPEINEEWITDKDRFAFAWQSAPDRLDAPLVRDETTGELVPTSWSEALDIAARGLAAAREAGGVGLLPGGRLTLEDSYAWSRFARTALGSNDIDHRARAHSAEEEQFLAHRVAGSGLGVTFGDLEVAPTALLVALEPEEECGTVFLRLRKGVLAGNVAVTTIAPFSSRGSAKLRADLITAGPGEEAAILDAVIDGGEHGDLAARLGAPGAVVLVGERAGALPGVLSAVSRLIERTGAALAWIPRRAGDRGAVDAGLLPGLLPGGRLVEDAEARVDLAAVWGVESIPATPGRDLSGIVADARAGSLGGLVVGGVDLDDLPDPEAAAEALASVGFVVQLEVRSSAVTDHADVVFPVAPPVEKAGTYLNWEGRRRPFGQVLASPALADRQVLQALAAELGVDLGVGDIDEVYLQLGELAGWEGRRAQAPDVAAPDAVSPETTGSAGQPAATGARLRLATWKLQLDAGRGQDGEVHLAGTAHRAVARVSAATAAAIGAEEGRQITVRTDAGAITVPLTIAGLPDDVVWLPENSAGSRVRRTLRAGVGDQVSVEVPR